MAHFAGQPDFIHRVLRALQLPMIDHRPWTALVLAGLLCTASSRAQEGADTGAAKKPPPTEDTTGTGAASSFGAPAAPPSAPSSPSAAPAQPEVSPSPFGLPPPSQGGTQGTSGAPSSAGPGTTGTGAGAETSPGVFGGTGPTPTGIPSPPILGSPGAATAFGGGAAGAVRPAPEAISTFARPVAYGQNSQIFSSAGIGHPRFRYTASVQIGFDDNVLQTPTNSPGVPEVTQRVEVEPAVPPQTQVVQLPPNPRVPIFIRTPMAPQFRTVTTVPGKPAVFKDEVVSPAIPAQSRISSFVIRTSGSGNVDFASRKTLFSMSVNLGVDTYTNRPGSKTDPTDSLSLTYLRRLTPRLTFSADIGASYQAQPDVQTLNTASGNVGKYFVGNGKFDLSYKWSKRFSTVTSLTLTDTTYEAQAQGAGDLTETTLGIEGRYLWSPRLTALADLRYTYKQFPNNASRDATDAEVLLGAEITLSSKFSATARFGESLQTFSQSGQSTSAPSMETSLSWRYNPFGFLTWSTHYGFEDPPDALTTVKTLRTGLGVVQALSKRLRLSAGLNYVSRESVGSLAAGVPTQDTVDGNLGMEYTLTRHFVLSTTYTYTNVLNKGGIGDYYRNQFFVGINYTF